MFNSFTSSKAPQNVALLIVKVRRDDHRDWLSEALGLLISKHLLGSGVPRCYHAIEILGDDCVI